MEPLAKVWVDERQSHFESIFGKQAALSRRAIGLHGWLMCMVVPWSDKKAVGRLDERKVARRVRAEGSNQIPARTKRP